MGPGNFIHLIAKLMSPCLHCLGPVCNYSGGEAVTSHEQKIRFVKGQATPSVLSPQAQRQ